MIISEYTVKGIFGFIFLKAVLLYRKRITAKIKQKIFLKDNPTDIKLFEDSQGTFSRKSSLCGVLGKAQINLPYPSILPIKYLPVLARFIDAERKSSGGSFLIKFDASYVKSPL